MGLLSKIISALTCFNRMTPKEYDQRLRNGTLPIIVPSHKGFNNKKSEDLGKPIGHFQIRVNGNNRSVPYFSTNGIE